MTAFPKLDIAPIQGSVSEAEWTARVDLAACYRLCDRYAMSAIIYTHITARVPGTTDQFLINPNGMLFSEITASSLLKVGIDGTVLYRPETPYGLHVICVGRRDPGRLQAFDEVRSALAVALQRVPDANVTWTESAMLKHKHSDVGVAVSIPGGLITPVVRKAETKGLAQISNEMKDYAARARARKLKPEEYQGGSTAVSNLGMFGIKNFQAVINPPHATILTVGAGEQRIVVKKGAPAVATVMSVTLSTDHRAVDGALGAELISAFKQLIENPMGMLV